MVNLIKKISLVLGLATILGCTNNIEAEVNNTSKRYKTKFELLDTYHTDNYEISVYNGCTEGNVSCDNIQFKTYNLKTNIRKTAIGSTKHLPCGKDELCKFYGYQFQIGNINYQLDLLNDKLIINGIAENLISLSDSNKKIQAYYVSQTKAYIYTKPSNDSKTNAYFIKGDVINPIDIDGSWVYVSYKNNTKFGWLMMSDLIENK